MIVFDLECRDGGHRFEGWFKSSDDFAGQERRGLVSCPACGSVNVGKAVQAPRLTRKGNQMPAVTARQRPEPRVAPPVPRPAPPPSPVASGAPLPPEALEMVKSLARMQAEALKDSRYVGDSFADDARAMHYGERDTETIHGQATLADAQELLEEGIAVMPLPFPVLPPDQTN